MQYAAFEIQGRKRLLDISEYEALLEIQKKPVAEAVETEAESGYFLFHGAYLPQPGISETKALKDLLAARDHWLGCLVGCECHPIALEDCFEFNAVRKGHALAIPVAALARASEAVAGRISPNPSKPALTCFLRYENLTPAENLLNRPGIFAFKGPPHSFGPGLPANWKSHTDADRAILTATDIFM
jgi:hypothetical protein